MRLTYYLAISKENPSNSIRARTKKDAATQRTVAGEDLFEEPQRVDLDYKDGFDIFTRCMKGEQFEPTNGPEKRTRTRKASSTDAPPASTDDVPTVSALPEEPTSTVSLDA